MFTITKESKSNNYGENIAVGFAAIQHSIQLLFSTPKGSMPYALGYGLELKDLLFKFESSDAENSSMAEFNTQLKAMCNDETINTSLYRVGTTVYISIDYVIDNETINASIPIANVGNNNYRLDFDNIIVS